MFEKSATFAEQRRAQQLIEPERNERAFHPQDCMLGSVLPARLIRALGGYHYRRNYSGDTG